MKIDIAALHSLAEANTDSLSPLPSLPPFSPTPDPSTSVLLSEICHQHPPPENPRRNGKIARLPRETRQMINQMLDDGLPYRVIIDELGEAGAGLNLQNLTNWVQGGYQDHFKHQELIERANAQVEFATQLLRETGNPDPTLLPRALNLIAGAQIMTAIMHHGKEALSAMLQDRPLAYLTLLNTLCRMADSTIKLESHRRALRAAARPPAPRPAAVPSARPGPGANPRPTAVSDPTQVSPVASAAAAPPAPATPPPAPPDSSQIKPNQALEKIFTPPPPAPRSDTPRSDAPRSSRSHSHRQEQSCF